MSRSAERLPEPDAKRAERYRRQAAELRAIAITEPTDNLREQLLILAQHYEELAKACDLEPGPDDDPTDDNSTI